MKPSTTIIQIFEGNKIIVPNYQRAYSWETEVEPANTPKQVNEFISDIEDYNKSAANSMYYFGHFLFEQKSHHKFAVIDGQQRLTTIIIFISALFKRLQEFRPLQKEEKEIYEAFIPLTATLRFETVDYDKDIFNEYIIDGTKKDKKGIKTQSAYRIIRAFEFFKKYLQKTEEAELLNILKTIQNASCSTHLIADESEAIQMFIFQNNRGKKPSDLEIIKAQFMYKIHLFGGDKKEYLIDDIKRKFENIYQSISKIENKIHEDSILIYTLRVYFNSLSESNVIEKINKILSEHSPIEFISSFTQMLANTFIYMEAFFTEDEKESMEIHSLLTLGGFGIAIPFIIKAYQFDLDADEINILCSKLESLILRKRLIKTRADLSSRLNQVYQEFTLQKSEVDPILSKIDQLKSASNDQWWLNYWNNDAFERSLQGGINSFTAKFLLWKYENYLLEQGKKGYALMRYDSIKNPELEHIAPKTENKNAGYETYDQTFIDQYLDCLGNYLLISKSHNCSESNDSFEKKLNSYNHLEQQREIQRSTASHHLWTKELIKARKDKIINFILGTF